MIERRAKRLRVQRADIIARIAGKRPIRAQFVEAVALPREAGEPECGLIRNRNVRRGFEFLAIKIPECRAEFAAILKLWLDRGQLDRAPDRVAAIKCALWSAQDFD